MRKKTVRISAFVLLLWVSFSLAAQEGEDLFLKASEDWLWGRWEEAELTFRRAAEISTGELKQICTLRSLQIRFDMGQYLSLLEEAPVLAVQGLNQKIKRDALIIEINTMEKLALFDQATQLIVLHNEFYNRDPVWQLMVWKFYTSRSNSEEADRASWIIRHYFPKSPEALILSGESIESVKPSLLFKS